MVYVALQVLLCQVTFLGANELLTSILSGLNKIIELATVFLIKAFYYCFYPFFTWYWWKPETNEKKKAKIKYIYYSLICHFKFNSKRHDFVDKLIDLMAKSYFVLILFSILITLYLSYYINGKEDFNKALKIAYHQQVIDSETTSQQVTLTGIGILEEDKEKLHVYNLACGNYKCAGIKVSNLEIKTYLPEDYSTSIPDKIIEQAKKEYEEFELRI
ncbi:hypothetical protein ACPC5U_13170 [Acinetobacter haemolyticus]|uniref:hypothetical protein n=1 Tax=Acinetobacter haemolyticus TaxID=29430 RepID=UPI003C1B2B40